jgi:hypothetical protein
VTGVFVFIAAAMLVVALAIGAMGPRSRNLALENALEMSRDTAVRKRSVET